MRYRELPRNGQVALACGVLCASHSALFPPSCRDARHPRAQHYLAFLYAVGLQVPQDYVLSYMWDNLAAAQNEKGARLSRDSLASKMTREQIAEAQRL
jgi:TPR repeat protein